MHVVLSPRTSDAESPLIMEDMIQHLDQRSHPLYM